MTIQWIIHNHKVSVLWSGPGSTWQYCRSDFDMVMSVLFCYVIRIFDSILSQYSHGHLKLFLPQSHVTKRLLHSILFQYSCIVLTDLSQYTHMTLTCSSQTHTLFTSTSFHLRVMWLYHYFTSRLSTLTCSLYRSPHSTLTWLSHGLLLFLLFSHSTLTWLSDGLPLFLLFFSAFSTLSKYDS